MKDQIEIVVMIMIVVIMLQISLTFLFTPEKANIAHYTIPFLVGCLLWYRKIRKDSTK